ncbi:ATP-grasp domain-containing protein [Virgibacillus halophilus]|uniref:ATP-grasp domain-containing protein n=1 Tax=Tigheibacillus halophilus TaxID=361280 RepID=A0ABU5CAB1_9BACI|nr:ATP-grasp domain-containing protein [Virgibacillus halophilus]
MRSMEEVEAFGEKHGYPIIIKASLGGGGRGMRIVRSATNLSEAYDRAKSEAKAAFGNDEIYVEKLIEHPKHIEVQIIGDKHGELVHLYERDCSVQRRHQKLVEIAPSVSLSKTMRQSICEAAVRLMKNVDYTNAGTVEFLVTGEAFYFIEVNPRVQVEHTITEMITGIDIVQTQIKIADGQRLSDPDLAIEQDKIQCNGYAIQSRVTTEDPLNNFMPDTGKINVYRSGGGIWCKARCRKWFSGS